MFTAGGCDGIVNLVLAENSEVQIKVYRSLGLNSGVLNDIQISVQAKRASRASAKHMHVSAFVHTKAAAPG